MMLWEIITGLCSILLLLIAFIMQGMVRDIRSLQEENKQILINYVHKDELKEQIRDIKDTMREWFTKLETTIEKFRDFKDGHE